MFYEEFKKHKNNFTIVCIPTGLTHTQGGRTNEHKKDSTNKKTDRRHCNLRWSSIPHILKCVYPSKFRFHFFLRLPKFLYISYDGKQKKVGILAIPKLKIVKKNLFFSLSFPQSVQVKKKIRIFLL